MGAAGDHGLRGYGGGVGELATYSQPVIRTLQRVVCVPTTSVAGLYRTHMFPSLSMRPDLRMRSTISSSALLEGAHTCEVCEVQAQE